MSVHRPNLALSLLKSAANYSGLECDITYAKLPFASRIGLEAYRAISELLPSEYLVGDAIFAPVLRNVPIQNLVRQYKSLHIANEPHSRTMPSSFWDRMESLCLAAREFVLELSQNLASQDHAVIGLSSTFHLVPSLALAKAIKYCAPQKLIVLGGAYCDGKMGASIMGSFPWIDIVVRGDGEDVFTDVIRRIHSCHEEGVPSSIDLAGIPGLIWRRKGVLVINEGARATNRRSLNEIPMPSYDDWFLQFSESAIPLPKEKTVLPLETSRGCWFGEKLHCIFCGLNGESLRFRSKSPERVLQEIANLQKYGVQNIDAVDLILDHGYFANVIPMLKTSNHKLSIFYEVKSNLSKAQVRDLLEAGICTIQPGIESLNSRLLELMRKGVKAYQNIRLIKWCAEFGVKVEWNLLYGIPGEMLGDYEKIISMIPLLHHLPPPSGGCVRLLMNRFSPIFDRPEEFGISQYRPVAAYEAVLGKESDVENIAYYFSHQGKESHCYLEQLQDAVQEWRLAFGSAVLVSVDREESLYIFDTRRMAKTPEIVLSGISRAVYLACDGAAQVDTLKRALQFSEQEIREELLRLSELGLILHVDDRYLSLAVPMNELVAPFLGSTLVGSIAKNLYAERAKLLWLHTETTRSPDTAFGYRS
ncbi:MAG: RiPP maturation radical SAM protein 1 [Nitrospira sp.]